MCALLVFMTTNNNKKGDTMKQTKMSGIEYTTAEFNARVGLDLLRSTTDTNKNKRLCK